MAANIHSVCVRPQHRAAVTGQRTLTFHRGEWAYCPDGSDGDHDWLSIDPMDLDELVRMVRAESLAARGAA
jgi:hypothetical protein